jgi:23S rRNA (uracil1939-C5)-methyltransferase
MQVGDEVVVDVLALAVGQGSVGMVVAGDATDVGMRGFVRNGVPGDRLKVRIEKVAKRHFEATLIDIIQPAVIRIAPECRYAKNCGGCDLQYVNMASQANLKYDLVCSAMQVQGFDTAMVRPLVTGKFKNYRRRVILHLAENGMIGFYKRQSHEVVAIRECLQLHPLLGEVLARLFEWQVTGFVLDIALETDGKDVSVVVRSSQDLLECELIQIQDFLIKLGCGVRIEEKGKVSWSNGNQFLKLEFAVDIPPLEIKAGAFTQINWDMNGTLVRAVVNLIASYQPQTVWDLYSGAGNFSFPLANAGISVVAVEASSHLVQAGQHYLNYVNSQHNLSLAVDFNCSSVERWLKVATGLSNKRQVMLKSAKDRLAPDVVLADPPRDGLKDCVKLLPDGSKLILVSCHLPSFVRDAVRLRDRGRKLIDVCIYDMFPLTNYVEVVSVWH